MLRVEIRTGDEEPRVVTFDDVSRVRFGRSPSNDIVLAAPYVSRWHGEFAFEDGEWYVRDLGSQMGVVIVHPGELRREERVVGARSAPLRGGEEIAIDATRMGVELKPLTGPARDDPPALSSLSVSRIAEGPIAEAPAFAKHQDTRKLELLLELSNDLNRLEGLDEVLDRIGRTVFESLPHASHFAICIPDPSGAFAPHFGVLRDGTRIRASQVGVSQSILDLVAERETAMLFRLNDRDLPPTESMLLHGISSSMAVPLGGAEGIAGVMLVENRSSGRPFDSKDLEFVIVLGDSAAFALERAQHEDDVARMFDGFIGASVTAIEARDPTTSGHSRRVSQLSVALAQAVGRSPAPPFASVDFQSAQLTELAYAALLHDFGKVAVRECVLLKAKRLYPEQVRQIESRFDLIDASYRAAVLGTALREGGDLAAAEGKILAFHRRLERALAFVHELNDAQRVTPEQAERLVRIGRSTFAKPDGSVGSFLDDGEIEALCIPEGTLTGDERIEIQAHVTHTYRALRQIPWPRKLARVPEIAVAHHEKLDGTGYPRGRGQLELPIDVRLLTVCDIYDALTASDRPYRSALPRERGLDVLREEARDGKIDAELVDLFIQARVWERCDEEATHSLFVSGRRGRG